MTYLLPDPSRWWRDPDVEMPSDEREGYRAFVTMCLPLFSLGRREGIFIISPLKNTIIQLSHLKNSYLPSVAFQPCPVSSGLRCGPGPQSRNISGLARLLTYPPKRKTKTSPNPESNTLTKTQTHRGPKKSPKVSSGPETFEAWDELVSFRWPVRNTRHWKGWERESKSQKSKTPPQWARARPISSSIIHSKKKKRVPFLQKFVGECTIHQNSVRIIMKWFGHEHRFMHIYSRISTDQLSPKWE